MRPALLLTAAALTLATAAPAFVVVQKGGATLLFTGKKGKAYTIPVQRSVVEMARDQYRHPAQTLNFFGIEPGHKIVEYSPGAGWYSALLSPLAHATGGTYTALVASPKGAERTRTMLADRKLAGTVATLDTATGTSDIAPGSQDTVLTFRNVHNLIMDKNPAAAANAFKAWFAMLKPGGTLGVVDHRLPESRDAAQEKTSGYLKRSTIVALATGAGFRLTGESEVNANPKDTANWPEGVWTLPPTYELKDVDRAEYAAIGESDRMTLKFVKPR